MTPTFYDTLVNIIQENGWIIGPQSTSHHDQSKVIDFDKVEQLRDESHTEYPDSFSLYTAQYIHTMEENGWWVKVCAEDTDEEEDERDDPFDDTNEIIEYVVDVHLYGYASDEPQVIDLTGDDSDDDSDSDSDDDNDNDNETEFDPWNASFWDPGPPVRNLEEDMNAEA